jgi:hypothetical protein
VQEPLDDPTETHGICDRHQQSVFEAFRSSSFPDTRWLFIVPSSDPSGYEHLLTILRDVPGARVIIDRRHGERRTSRALATPERRRFDRRVRRPEPSGLGYALVRFTVSEGARTVPPDRPAEIGGTPGPGRTSS